MASASLDAWAIAKSRYLASLTSDEERRLFETATPENLLKEVEELNESGKRRSKFRKSMAKIQPLVTAINDYGRAMDVFTNTSSAILSPLWGSIRVILVLATKYGAFFDKMVATLKSIGEALPRLNDYHKLFSEKNPRLIDAVANAYMDVIKVCSDIRLLLNSKSFRTRLLPFRSVKSFEESIHVFQEHRAAVNEELRLSHMLEQREERAIVLRNQELQRIEQEAAKRQNLLDQLSKVDVRRRHRKLVLQRHCNTGNWIINTEEFIAWKCFSGSCLFCCYGIPGSGKSVLTSIVVDDILSQSASQSVSPIAFYYCDYSDKRTLSAVAIFSSIMKQLLSMLPEWPEGMADEIKNYLSSESKPDAKALLKSLMAISQVSPSTTIIIDGIDELEDRELQFLYCHMETLSSYRFRVFLTSREDSSGHFEGFTSRHRVEASTIRTEQDITSYIRASVRDLIKHKRLVIRDASLEDGIVNALIKGAKGMFLWIYFQLQDLCEAESDYAIHEVLANLPLDLAQTYERLLNRISGSDRQIRIKRLFIWVLFSRRPLTLNEMAEAIAFDLDDEFWDQRKVITDVSHHLLERCHRLIVVDEETETISLSHYTVQQYLLDPRSKSSFCFKELDARIFTGEVCVAYLCFADFETQITRYDENYSRKTMNQLQKSVNGQLITGDASRGRSARAMHLLRRYNPPITDLNIDYSRHIPSQTQSKQALFEAYHFLDYVSENWIWHTNEFGQDFDHRRAKLLITLLYEKNLLFHFKPWELRKDELASLPMSPIEHLQQQLRPMTSDIASIIWGIENSVTILLEHVIDLYRERDCNLATLISGMARSRYDTMGSLQQGLDLVFSSIFRGLADACSHGDLELVTSIFNTVYKHTRSNQESDALLLDDLKFELLTIASENGHPELSEYFLTIMKGVHRPRTLVIAISQGNLAVVDSFIAQRLLLYEANTFNALDLILTSQKTQVVLDGRSISIDPLRKEVAHCLLFLAYFQRARQVPDFEVRHVIDKIASMISLNEMFQFRRQIIKFFFAGSFRRYGSVNSLVLQLIIAYVSIHNSHFEAVRYLLRAGADPNIVDFQFRTPLYFAVDASNIDMVKELLESGANPNFGHERDRSHLLCASEKGNMSIVRLLLKAGANIDHLHTHILEWSALMVALGKGRGGDAGALVDAGSPLFLGDFTANQKSLFFAQAVNLLTISQLATIIAQISDVEPPIDSAHIFSLLEPNRWTKTSSKGDAIRELGGLCSSKEAISLHLRKISSGYYLEELWALKIMQQWLRKEIACADNQHIALPWLDVVSQTRETQLVNLLLKLGANPNMKGTQGETALHIATQRCCDNIVRVLLTNHVDVNCTAYDEQLTALHLAAREGHEIIVQILLAEDRIDLNKTNKYGGTPLQAAAPGHIDIAETLLDQSTIDPNLTNHKGESPLWIAAHKGQLHIAKILLASNKTNVNLSNCGLESPLWIAAKEGHIEVVKLLLKHPKIDVNAPDREGISPLVVATRSNHKGIAYALLNPGAVRSRLTSKELYRLDSTSQTSLTKETTQNLPQWALQKLLGFLPHRPSEGSPYSSTHTSTCSMEVQVD